MPAAVLDLDLKNLPETVEGLSFYSKAFVLIRYGGRPVGQTMLPVVNGTLQVTHHFDEMADAAQPFLQKSWLHEYLSWQDGTLPGFALPKATIAICTRNRTEDLQRCLEILMQLPDDGQEILVIDNCPSTDETQHLVAHFSNVRYIREPRAGLNIARNRALQEASHEIVAFIDDDAVPDRLWLRNLVRNFSSPLVLCVTGMTMPLELETEAQEAFEKYSPFSKGFKKVVHSASSRNPLSTGQVGAGANMAFRKDVLRLAGLFDEALDAGTPTESGGDHEYFARILLRGYHIVYEPEALNWHRHRLTWKETKKAIRGYGIGVYAFWTRLLVEEKEIGILLLPYSWFLHTQLPNLVRSIFKRPGSHPLSLVISEFWGCFLGPIKYFLSRQRVKRKPAI